MSWLALLLAASVAPPGAGAERAGIAERSSSQLAGPPYHGPPVPVDSDAGGDGAAAGRGQKPPIHLQVEGAVDRWLERVFRTPGEQSRRLSVRRGVLGLGGYTPIGGQDPGIGPPPRLYPGASAGNSINVDPFTGRLR